MIAVLSWIGIGTLCTVSLLIMLIQGRDRYGNDGCADDRKRLPQ